MSKFGKFLLQALAFCLLGFVALAFLSYLNSQPLGGQSSIEAEPDSKSREQSDLNVRIDARAAQGMNASDMDIDFLGKFEREMAGEMRQVAEENLRAQGIPSADLLVESSAFYTFAETHKLLVLRIVMKIAGGSSVMRQAMVTGFVNDEQRVVTCVTMSAKKIPITYGKCGNAIERAFGASVGVD